jgi:hypothetical protein
MQRFHKQKDARVGTPIIVANSTTINNADPLTIDADGFIIVATAGDKIIGHAIQGIVSASDNETVAKKTVQYLQNDGVEMVFTSDQACTQTDIGAYADITGTTGAIQIDLNAGATGQYIVKAFDPEGDGDTDLVVVEVAEPQTLAFAQA